MIPSATPMGVGMKPPMTGVSYGYNPYGAAPATCVGFNLAMPSLDFWSLKHYTSWDISKFEVVGCVMKELTRGTRDGWMMNGCIIPPLGRCMESRRERRKQQGRCFGDCYASSRLLCSCWFYYPQCTCDTSRTKGSVIPYLMAWQDRWIIMGSGMK